jgi:hypothetical protein
VRRTFTGGSQNKVLIENHPWDIDVGDEQDAHAAGVAHVLSETDGGDLLAILTSVSWCTISFLRKAIINDEFGTKEIAARHGTSEQTIKSSFTEVARKLDGMIGCSRGASAQAWNRSRDR